jgi:hypothetical protein
MADEPDEDFLLSISPAQVERIVHQAVASERSGASLLRVLLSLGGSGERLTLEELVRDRRYQAGELSQSILISLLVLSAFASGETHKVTVLAKEMGMNTATLARYLRTWVAVGVLEQDLKTRGYRVAARWMIENIQTSGRSGPEPTRRAEADRASSYPSCPSGPSSDSA